MNEPANVPRDFDSTVDVIDNVTCTSDRACRICKANIPAADGAISVSTRDRVTGALQYHDWYHPRCWAVYWGAGLVPGKT